MVPTLPRPRPNPGPTQPYDPTVLARANPSGIRRNAVPAIDPRIKHGVCSDSRPDVCDRALATLVQEGALVCGTDGRYSTIAALQRRAAL